MATNDIRTLVDDFPDDVDLRFVDDPARPDIKEHQQAHDRLKDAFLLVPDEIDVVATALADHAALTTSAHGGIVSSSDARLTNARTPTSHASTHASGGSDAITPAAIGAEPSGAYRPGGTDIPVADGGTGASDAATARAHLGLAIGTHVQAFTDVLANTTASFTTADETKLDSIIADASATTASLRTLGTGAQQAAAGTDSRLTNTRTPTDGSVTNAKVSASAAIAESKLALASDAAAGTASRRTLGTGATQAAAGNDARLTNQRVPTDGSVTNAKVASGAAIAESKLDLASDAAAGTASRRSLGTGSTQAAAGNDSRLSNARTPTNHATRHAPGGVDELTIIDGGGA